LATELASARAGPPAVARSGPGRFRGRRPPICARDHNRPGLAIRVVNSTQSKILYWLILEGAVRLSSSREQVGKRVGHSSTRGAAGAGGRWMNKGKFLWHVSERVGARSANPFPELFRTRGSTA